MPDKQLVTGAAGFFGSHLAERLLADGHEVRGVDCLLPHYSPGRNRDVLRRLERQPGYEFVAADLRTSPLDELLDDVDTIFHFAALPGVPASWTDAFADYLSCNVLATQRLLNASRHRALRRFVFASSGSVYGESTSSSVDESEPTAPHSPYSLTKLSAERLCALYADNWGIPVICLRYFYGFGSRQRPDVVLYRMIDSCLRGTPFTLLGDGSATRDLVHVRDIVDAGIRAAASDSPRGAVVNVCTGTGTTVAEMIGLVEATIGRPLGIERRPLPEGYVSSAVGSARLAADLLGWTATVPVGEGLAEQVAWQAEGLR